MADGRVGWSVSGRVAAVEQLRVRCQRVFCVARAGFDSLHFAAVLFLGSFSHSGDSDLQKREIKR